MKTHSDLIKCTQIPEDTQICFLDDVFYPDMKSDNIYYINVKPYIHDLTFDDMVTRLINSNILVDIDDPTVYRTYITTFMEKFNYIYVEKTVSEQNIDKVLSKKILQHLQDFFKIKPTDNTPAKIVNKTKRNKNNYNKTLKKRA
jgi:hypothetical protein